MSYIHTYILHITRFFSRCMGQLIMCNICGMEFDSEAELKKHEPFCAFNRKKYYLQQEKSKKS